VGEARHTPGPWAWETPLGEHCPWVVQDGKQAYEWDPIATLGYYTEEGPPTGSEAFQRLQANAQLIATAPDMLEALIEVRAVLHQHYVDWDGEPEDAVPLQTARAQCDAVIAKALRARLSGPEQ